MSEKKTALSSFRNQDWKTVKVETEKINKRLINKYPNKQHHETKQSNLYRNETSLWKSRVSAEKHEQND